MTETVDWNFVVRAELVVAFCEVSVGQEDVGTVEYRLGELEVERLGGHCCGPKRVPNLLAAVEGRRCLPELVTFTPQLSFCERHVRLPTDCLVEQRVILSCRANVCAARWAYNNGKHGELHKSPEVDIYDARNGMLERFTCTA